MLITLFLIKPIEVCMEAQRYQSREDVFEENQGGLSYEIKTSDTVIPTVE